MVTCDDDGNKGEKRCFDLFATLVSIFGEDDEIRAKLGHKEEQDRNFLMIHTLTSAKPNTFLLGKRKIDDHDESKNQENTSSSDSSSLVEYKRRRVVEESDDEPIRAQPIRQIKPSVKRKEPVRRETVVTPGWVLELMRRFKGDEAKMIVEKVMTKTDLTPSQGRLLMPFNQMVTMDFLTKAELKILQKAAEVKKGVDVILLNRSGDEQWDLNLRIWKMRSSFNYALCSGWNQVVHHNNLQRNQTITLWSFHSRDGTLYFAFDPPAQAQDQALALVPFNPAAPYVAPVVISEDPFVCEETNKRLFPFPKKSRTPRVCVGIITRYSRQSILEGLDLNKTPPEEECMEMTPLEAVQETHITSTSQESLTGTSLVSFTETSQESFTETFDLELRL